MQKKTLIPNSLINTEDQQVMSSLRKRQSGLFPLSNLTNLQAEMGFLALFNSLYHLLPTLLALFRAGFTQGHVPTVWRNPWQYLSQRLEDTLPYSLDRTVPLVYHLFCLQRWRKLCDATTFHNALLHHGKHPDVGYEDFTSTAKAFSQSTVSQVAMHWSSIHC